MPEKEKPITAKMIEWVRKDLEELGVADPARFVPDDDRIAAAVVDWFLIADDYKPPSFEEPDALLWLLSKGINDGESEIKRFQEVFQQLYHDDTFRNEVLFVIGERAHASLREADARWEADIREVLDRDFKKLDLVQLFGPSESETTKIKPGAGMTDLGAVREFIEQKYPRVQETPGVLSIFVFSAGTIIDAGRGAELDELMCERLLVASSPKILGPTVIFSSHLHEVMGQAGNRLAKKYLDLSAEEITLIQTTPLKPEHQKILALF